MMHHVPRTGPTAPTAAGNLAQTFATSGESVVPGDHEQQLVTSRRGKWSQAGVPHNGWSCVDIEDLGSPDLVCEMCESQDIRYVHHMSHEEYPEQLQVGCVCAGHMEGDLASARGREASMKSRADKRKRWVTRRWKRSAKGNHWLEADGYRVTVYRRDSGWAATVALVIGDYEKHSKRFYATEHEAMLASFDVISKLLARNG